MDKKLSTDRCPKCSSKSIIELNFRPYESQVYECKGCKSMWDENTYYCKKCLDVIQYCDCYKDLY